VQLVYALGKKEDVLVVFSTSGNSLNVVKAAKCARALGIFVIALTGMTGGKLLECADICLRAPEKETFKVQEYHLPIYHAICAEAEDIIFGNRITKM
jgi:D-sedoheptulose 7-phosphate isomerase